MKNVKKVIGVVLFILLLLLVFKEKKVSVIMISGLEEKIDFKVSLNDEVLFDSLLERQYILHQNFSTIANSGFNKVRVTSDAIDLDVEYEIFVLFQQWLVMGPYLNEDTGEIEFDFENKFFKHYMK